jgi:hypothetical protein
LFFVVPSPNFDAMSTPIPIRTNSSIESPSTSTTTSTAAGAPNAPIKLHAPDAAHPGWLREPLLHFVLLGAALFALDQFFIGRAADPRAIVVGAEVDAEAKQVFKASRNRDPSAEELKALRNVWLDNEILYREGLALGVDKGDSAIRERVIFKALSVINASVKLPEVDEKTLRTWFEKNIAKYDDPPRFDFQEAVMSSDSSEAAIRAFVDSLNAGTPGVTSDSKAGLRVFKGRPHSNVAHSYGEEFAKALEASPVGEWRAHRSRGGLLAIRLDKVSPGTPAVFEKLVGVVKQDWVDATLSEQRSEAVRAMGKKYNIKFESAESK